MNAETIIQFADQLKRELKLRDQKNALVNALVLEIAMAEAPGAAYPSSVASSIERMKQALSEVA